MTSGGRYLTLFFFLLMTFSSQSSAAVQRGLSYGSADNSALLMDAFVPEGPGPFPAVILVHGGGWVAGDRRYNVEPLFAPLQRAGYAWFSISYRLATNVFLFGEAVDDVQQAIHHIRDHAQSFRIDPSRIVLLGESAGAHLGTLAAMREPQLLAGVVAMYCPSDLEWLAQNTQAVPEPIRAAITTGGLAPFLLPRLRELSPMQHVQHNLPPFLLIHGTADRLVPFEQSVRFQAKLRDAGVPCELVAVPDAGHGLRWWGTASKSSGYQSSLLDWLNRLPAKQPTLKAS